MVDYEYPKSYGSAIMHVNLKVQPKSDAPSVTYIPLRLKYNLEIINNATAHFIFFDDAGIPLFSKYIHGGISGDTAYGIFPYNAPATGGTYEIYVEAHAFSGREVGNSQAVVDPFLFIWPKWEYAEYFEVLEESSLHPGEWVKVTRKWETPIPAPDAMLLLGSGLLGLIGYARRKLLKN